MHFGQCHWPKEKVFSWPSCYLPLQWRHMSVMATKITGNWTIGSAICLGWHQRNVNTLHSRQRTRALSYYSNLTLSQEFQPMAAQLSMKAALPLAKILATASCHDTTMTLTSLGINCPLGDVEVILQMYFSNSFYKFISWALTVKSVLGECHRTPLMISQHWFR